MSLLSSALGLVTHGGVAEAKRWFDTVCDLHEQVRDSDDSWQRFREQLPAAAERQSFSADAARRFTDGMEQLADDPAELMAHLHANRDDLPSLYTAATQGGAGAGAVGGRFDWLHGNPELGSRVRGALGWSPEHYESELGPYLDGQWGPGWEQHPAEHKSAWLTGVLGSQPAADRFGWVRQNPALAGQVANALGCSPEEYESRLGPYLDDRWGAGWERHPAEHKSAWLDQLVSGANPAPAP